MMTIEQRKVVLRALADGEISLEEAEDRLASFEDGAGFDDEAVEAVEREPDQEKGRRAPDGRRGGRPSVDEVIALASHGIDAAYLKGSGRRGSATSPSKTSSASPITARTSSGSAASSRPISPSRSTTS